MAPGRPGRMRCFGHDGVERAPFFDAPGRRGDVLGAAHQLRDVLLERLAVALAERRAEALAVVAQEHELYGRGASVGRLDERFGSSRSTPSSASSVSRRSGPRVVGDLVVIGVVDVDDRRAAVHLFHYQRRRQRAQDRRSWRRELSGTASRGACDGSMPARLARDRLEVFLDHLAEGQNDRHAQVVVRADEERVPGAALAQALAAGP